MSTLYAAFIDNAAAERAAGALLDHGARQEDISLLANDKTAAMHGSTEAASAEHSAKTGLSTTTPGDVAAGTMKGAVAGISIGAAAAIAALFIPGIGLVVGGGALAAALIGAGGTALAGAAAGSIAGLLKDQGVPEEMVAKYTGTFEEGGAILALAVPTGELDASEAESILAKYGASNVATYNAPRMLSDNVSIPGPDVPLVVQNTNSDIGPVVMGAPVVAVAASMAVDEIVQTRTVVDQASGMAVTQIAPAPAIEVIDPVSGTVQLRPVETMPLVETVVPTPTYVVPGVVVGQATTLPPTHEVVSDVSGALHQTVGHSTVVSETPVVVTDPATGLPRAGVVVEEQRSVVAQPLTVDENGNPVEFASNETVITRDKHVELR